MNLWCVCVCVCVCFRDVVGATHIDFRFVPTSTCRLTNPRSRISQQKWTSLIRTELIVTDRGRDSKLCSIKP